jgi:acetyl-CoA acetyltransferase family protein
MTAEKVARQYGITREEQDAFALESQTRAACAIREGVFSDEIVPVGNVLEDEHPRPDISAGKLAALKPAFTKDGTVTAGNASGINDGASALLLVGGPPKGGHYKDADAAFGHTPLARVITSAVAGVDPSVMGIGPVPAVRKALGRAGLSVDQIDLWELNEAFASQSIACIRDLQLDPAKVNIYGGAIALGHALGSSGSRMMATLVHALRRRKARYGVATMCIGVGQGIALVIERL